MFEEDFSVFTDPDGLGDTAVIGVTTVNGIFENEYIETTFNGTPVAGVHPVFGCAENDLPEYTYGTDITINSVVYKIRNWKPDGIGWVELILEKQ